MINIISSDVYEKINKNSTIPFLGTKKFNFKNILSWNEIENYLNNPYFYNIDNVHIIDENNSFKCLEKKVYPWKDNFSYSPKEIFENINSGKTFYLDNFNRFNKRCNDISSEIQQNIFGINLDFHVYGGLRKDSNSFFVHKDFANNLILQIDGKSNWKVYNSNNSIKNRVLSSDENLELLIDCVLTPGDLLYIPMGNYHKCNPLSKRLSISVCFIQQEEIFFVDTNRYSFN